MVAEVNPKVVIIGIPAGMNRQLLEEALGRIGTVASTNYWEKKGVCVQFADPPTTITILQMGKLYVAGQVYEVKKKGESAHEAALFNKKLGLTG